MRCPPDLTKLGAHQPVRGRRAAVPWGSGWPRADGHLYAGLAGGSADRADQEAQRTPLASRPYDLRHAAVSTWLSAGVDPAIVAEWAGHSLAVLMEIYAACLYGQDVTAKRLAQAALGR